MKINDCMTLDASGLALTRDGYLVGDAKVSRAGNVQSYFGFELGLKGADANKAFGVYRDPDVVFDQQSMMSLAGRPVTRGHPPNGVSADSWKELTVGQMGGVIRRDGEHVVAPMAIMDAAAVKEVMSGARGLSAGYTVDVVPSEGIAADGTPYQFKQAGELRFNHVAYLPDNNPRAGNTKIGDGQIDFQPGELPNNHKGVPMDLKSVVLGDSVAQVSVADLAVVEKYKADMTRKLADAEAETKKVKEDKDEEIGTLKAKLKKAEDAALVDVDALVASRIALVGQVHAIDSSIVVAGKTDAELRKTAVAKRLGDAIVVDSSEAEINGMFKAIAKDAMPGNPAAAVFKDGLHQVGDASTKAQEALAKSTADHNAWRNQ